MRLGIDCLTKGGKLIVVGLFGGDVTISTPLIPMKALTIQGSYVGSLAELKELLELVSRTGLPALPVGTRKLDRRRCRARRTARRKGRRAAGADAELIARAPRRAIKIQQE